MVLRRTERSFSYSDRWRACLPLGPQRSTGRVNRRPFSSEGSTRHLLARNLVPLMLDPRLYDVLAEALATRAGRWFKGLLVGLVLGALLAGVYLSY